MPYKPESIRELRSELNLNQREFGQRLGVSQKTISRWENGNIVPGGNQLGVIFDIGLKEGATFDPFKPPSI